MSPQALSVSGGSLPHNNMQPYLTVIFIIAMQGVFPPARSRDITRAAARWGARRPSSPLLCRT